VKIVPYLNFNGQCEAAFKFYEQLLGGKIVAMTPFEGTPAAGHAPAGWESKILHACLAVGDQLLMASDAPSSHFEAMKGFNVTLAMDDTAKAERIFNALADGGTVQMPFQETFWAAGFGMVVDRFGTPWSINCEKAGESS
jgi:PhnB protein